MKVEGPPQFLNHSVQEETKKEDTPRWRHGGRRHRKEKKGVPSGILLCALSACLSIFYFFPYLHFFLFDSWTHAVRS